MTEAPSCVLKQLPPDLIVPAAAHAVLIRPENHPAVGPDEGPLKRTIDEPMPIERIAFMVTKYWGDGGVHLTVGFLDNPPADLQARIISHMNAWGKEANILFVASSTDPQVRIARVEGDGYWSYLGTDIKMVPAGQPTMNLDGFTMNTPESEYRRVVRHETCHTMGVPHEHMRADIVSRINPKKAIRYFGATQGWSKQEVIQQVLTPLSEDNFLIQTPTSEEDSIMCYQLPGSIMKDGKPVVGGIDITPDDYFFAGMIYPLSDGAP